MRSCYKSNFENGSNYFLIKGEMCYWKDKIIKSETNQVKNISYRKCIWLKRIKTRESYAETIIASSENV